MIEVRLTPDELWQASSVGTHRLITTLKSTKPHFSNGLEWSTQIEACAAELAFAKWMGVYWTGGVFDGDVASHDAGGRQVRHTSYPSGSLIIYPEDDPNDTFVLITGVSPVFRIVGWIKGFTAHGVGESHPWWTEPHTKKRASWWVPQDELRPIIPIGDEQ